MISFRNNSRSPELEFVKISPPVSINPSRQESLLSTGAGILAKTEAAVGQITMPPVYLDHTLPSSGIPLKLEGSHDRTSHSSFHHPLLFPVMRYNPQCQVDVGPVTPIPTNTLDSLRSSSLQVVCGGPIASRAFSRVTLPDAHNNRSSRMSGCSRGEAWARVTEINQPEPYHHLQQVTKRIEVSLGASGVWSSAAIGVIMDGLHALVMDSGAKEGSRSEVDMSGAYRERRRES